MSDLVDKLRAEIAKDQRLANGTDEQAHAKRHWPDRVERQAEAFLELMEGHEGVHRCDWGEHRGGEFGECRQLKSLAKIYGIEVDK